MTEKILQPTKFEHNKSNYLKNSLAIAVTFLVLLVVLPANPSKKTVDLSDTEAMTLVMLLLDPADIRWANGFANNWLEETANLDKHEQKELMEVAREYKEDPSVLGRLNLATEKLDRLREHVKQHAKGDEKEESAGLSVLFAQSGMTAGVNSLTAVARSGGTISSKVVANVVNNFGHTTKATTTVKMGSRSVTASSSTGTSVSTTAYMLVCPDDVSIPCLDGTYTGYSTAQIVCNRYGVRFVPVNTSGGSTFPKHVTLTSIKFTSVATGAIISHIFKANGSVFFWAKVRKSSTCGATYIPTAVGFVPDAGIQLELPSPLTKNIYLTNGNGNSSWLLKTKPDNAVFGEIDGVGDVGPIAGCEAIDSHKVKTIKVI